MAVCTMRFLAFALVTLGPGCGTRTPRPTPASELKARSAKDSNGGAAPQSDAVAIGVGAAHACLVREEGELLCWGANHMGQLGVELTNDARSTTKPVAVAQVQSVFELALGSLSTCVKGRDDEIGCTIERGVLGSSSETPLLRYATSKGELVSRSGALCVLEDGAATCWGDSHNGSLTPGLAGATEENSARNVGPAKLDLPGGVRDVAIGHRHSCALFDDGRVDCWGINNFGQLGAAVRESSVPRNVRGLDNVVALSSGSFHTCALTSDERVYCWGRADEGQLGVGAVPPRKFQIASLGYPSQVEITGVQSIEAHNS
ncbi:MAG: hypothetical protein GY811_07745 [Myxococcales bacterium]|nr:hypothetical protein [Myxococcales bacterium]